MVKDNTTMGNVEIWKFKEKLRFPILHHHFFNISEKIKHLIRNFKDNLKYYNSEYTIMMFQIQEPCKEQKCGCKDHENQKIRRGNRRK